VSLAEFFVLYPEFIKRVRDISRHPMFRTKLELSTIKDPEIAHEFFSNLLSIYMWVLDSEIEIKKRGLNPSEYVFTRGIITRLLRNFSYPFLMISKKRLEKNLRILSDWLSSIKIQLMEMGVSAEEENEIEYPPQLLEMRSISYIKVSENFFFSIIDKESPVKKLLEDLIAESKRLLARFNIHRMDIINFSRYYPECIVSILRMKEILDVTVQFWDGTRFPLAPPDLITMLAEFYLATKSGSLLLEKIPPCEMDELKKVLRWGPRDFRGVVYYFTDEDCPGCRALENILDFWDFIGYLEANKYRVIIAERNSLEGRMLFDACFIKATPSLLFGIVFLHGLKIPQIDKKRKEDKIRLKTHFRKIFQETWFPPIQTVEFRNLLDLQRILESPLLKYEREYILRTYREF